MAIVELGDGTPWLMLWIAKDTMGIRSWLGMRIFLPQSVQSKLVSYWASRLAQARIRLHESRRRMSMMMIEISQGKQCGFRQAGACSGFGSPVYAVPSQRKQGRLF